MKTTLSAVNNGTRNATVVSTITSMGSTLTSSYAATIVNGSTSVIASVNETMGGMTSMASATEEGSSAGGAAEPTSAEGLAVATRVPLAVAAMGIMGFIGAGIVL